MTDLTNSGAIAAEIESLRSDLDIATAAIPVIGKAATLKATQLEQALTEAQAKFAEALSNELLEAQKARLANFSAIRVDWDREETSIIHASYTIIYTRTSYDDRLGSNVPREHTIKGFSALDENALEYLLTVRPDAIPAPILALAPGDPHKAFDIYLAGKARGYLRA